jgi:PBP1b-binding outer membrane lipoprotein LpoB
MRPLTIILFVCVFVLTSGCSSQPAPPAAAAPSPSNASSSSSTPSVANPSASPSPNASPVARPSVDACTLLVSDEIKAVQGESLKQTIPSNRATGDFLVTQCYYELPTRSNSVSLTLTEKNSEKQGGQSVKEFWETTFGKDENKSEQERKKEREREKKKPGVRAEGEEEEESAPLEKVSGLGDEAFWSASSVGGALYVLKRDRFIRISVGGKGDAEAKLKKSKTLAQNALRRL